MARATFETNPVQLSTLLNQCEIGKIQLPDFQRSWVWEEQRIIGLIASVSRGFPIGALMTLKTQHDAEPLFAYRLLEGTPDISRSRPPEQLLLDGQQRLTSLFQSCIQKQSVITITPKKRLVKRWFYIDIEKSLDKNIDREAAILTVPEDRCIKENFDKDIKLDLSSPELEYKNLMYPLNQAFDWDGWQDAFGDYWNAQGRLGPMRDLFKRFKDEVLRNFGDYQVPVISLAADTPREAVCLVFEKVNTGGKQLDAFELLTAVYAAQGHKLRDDWLGADGKTGIQHRLTQFGRAAGQEAGILSKVAATDFLQAISLLHARAQRLNAESDPSIRENELPAVRVTRQTLLDLPLFAYLQYRDQIISGFERAAKFMRGQKVYTVLDLPYQTQLVPLAAIFAIAGDKADHANHMRKIARWYWCGVFGELYGSAVETRFAKDIMEVPAWLTEGKEPSTVREGTLRADRLRSMRTRQSAAYKGIQALLMQEGARDFRSGQALDQTIFFDESVDIHHIFPKAWCQKNKVTTPELFDSVLNKTPISARTNKIIGGGAPSEYLAKLTAGKGALEPPINEADLNNSLKSHLIDPQLLRTDDFSSFIMRREEQLLALISRATGNQPQVMSSTEDGEEISDNLAYDAGLISIESEQ